MTTFKFDAHDCIVDNSNGAKSDGMVVWMILDCIQQAEDSTYYNDFYPPMAKYWRELVVDQSAEEPDIDIDYYTGLLSEHCQDLLPAHCFFTWADNDLRVVPDVEGCQEELSHEGATGEEYPTDEDGDGINPDQFDHFLEVNERGNTALYSWSPKMINGQASTIQYEWREVWSCV